MGYVVVVVLVCVDDVCGVIEMVDEWCEFDDFGMCFEYDYY